MMIETIVDNLKTEHDKKTKKWSIDKKIAP